MSAWLRPLLLALLCLAGAGAVAAEDPAGPDCPPAASTPDEATLGRWAAEARDRGLLWSVEKNGQRGWLYGTIHVARGPWTVPGPVVAQALRQAQRLALEIDLLDPPQLQQLQQLSAATPKAPRLAPARAARLAAQSRAACLGEALAGLRPELQVSGLLALAGRRQGLDPAYGIDIVLSGLFHHRGLPVLSLETPAEQMAALVGGDSAALVDEGLDELESGRGLQTMLRLAEAWARSDLDELAGYERWCDCLVTPAQRAQQARLVDARNRVMVRRIEARLGQGGPLFVAVGALHLTGPQGLPALLAARGYRLTPLLPARVDAATTGANR